MPSAGLLYFIFLETADRKKQIDDNLLTNERWEHIQISSLQYITLSFVYNEIDGWTDTFFNCSIFLFVIYLFVFRSSVMAS